MQPHRTNGTEVASVREGSPAHVSGILPGDTVLTVNGHRIADVLDLLFYSVEDRVTVVVQRKDRKLTFRLGLGENHDTGLTLRSFKIRTCNNKCLFCFVSQLPKGLRKTLYIKDEDFRMSFLYGNYVTLSKLSQPDKKRIVDQRLSPLYISVHSTDRSIRNTLLGNPKAPDILKELTFFKEHRIRMHCQIVLCPGYNDGRVLQQTIRDLYKLYPFIASIAVVPVGLTAHRKTAEKLRPVGREDARKAIDAIDSFQRRFRKKHGDSIVYCADELYIKAGEGFPPFNEYGDLPQIENGVGMVPLFVQHCRKVKVPQAPWKKRFITFTGTSFYPFLSKFVDKLRKGGFDITAVQIENAFFGSSVTVAGLLTGRDVLRALTGTVKENDILLIPDVVMREGEEVFLDDVSRQDLENLLGIKALVTESTPKGVIDAILSLP